MKSSDEIERLVKNTRVTTCKSVDDRILCDAKIAFLESTKSGTMSIQSNPSIWRIIMKSRITKFATAAVIIIGVLIGIHQLGVTMSLTNIAFAKMTEAIKSMPWVHIVYTEYSEETEFSREEWLSNKLKILAGQEYNGMIVYWDYGNDEQYVYNPESDTITASYRSGKDFEVAEPYNCLTKQMDHIIGHGGSVIQQEGQYNNRDVKIYEFTMPLKDNSGDERRAVIIKMTVERNTNLPIVGEKQWVAANGEILKKEQLTYDYPERLSLDINDVGIPLSAKLINKLPPPDLKRIRQKYGRCEEKLPSKYIAIETTHHADSGQIYEVSIVYKSDRHQRINDFSDQALGCSGDTFDAIFGWVLEGVSCNRRTDIFYDGQYIYWHEYYNGKWHLNFTPKQYSPKGNLNPSRALEDVVRFPIIWEEAKIVENNYTKENNLMCVVGSGGTLICGTEKIPLRQVTYLDPQRDYRLYRIEIYHEKNDAVQQTKNSLRIFDPDSIWGIPISVAQVVEYAKTELGLWYPKVIEKRAVGWHQDGTPYEQHTFRTIYLNTEPEFPEGIFDPENLPE